MLKECITPPDESIVSLVDGLAEEAESGGIRWIGVVYTTKDNEICYAWSNIHNQLTAVGAVEMLKNAILWEE